MTSNRSISLYLPRVVREALDRLAGWQGETAQALALRLLVEGLMKSKDAFPEPLRDELQEEWHEIWDEAAQKRQAKTRPS